MAKLNKMLKQMQKMQQDMMKMQDSLSDVTVEGSSGGGMVKAVVTGQQQLKEIKIDPEVVDPEDVELLEDMILAAVNEAMTKASQMAEEQMSGLTKGLNIPGM